MESQQCGIHGQQRPAGGSQLGAEGTDTGEYFATCAQGLEAIVATELRGLGAAGVRPLSSGVAFRATIGQACRAMLWLRCASRVLRVVARVAASTADELYEGCAAIAWERFIDPQSTIAVFSKGTNAAINNSTFAALRVKDAICDRLTHVCGSRPSVDAKAPDIPVRVNLHASKATIYLDLCGRPLHERGYRVAGATVDAPIKETLAAAVLVHGGWPAMVAAAKAPDAGEGAAACLVDPFCGSGTIAIEAALMAADIAPGILRQDWCVCNWRCFDQTVLDRLLDEADERAEVGSQAALAALPVLAGDIDPRAIEVARACAKRAGVANLVRFMCVDAGAFPAEDLPGRGLVATNPPYGQRIMSASQLPALMDALRSLATGGNRHWDICAIVADAGVDAMLGAPASDVVETYNGPIEATIRLYDALTAHMGAVSEDYGQLAQEFSNRLRKMARLRGKWARRNGVTCYRVYDADLPDFALSVDLYQGAGDDSGKRWVHVCEYAPPKSIDPNLAAKRVNAALGVIRDTFDVAASNVFLKRRVRSRGGSQYATPDAGPGSDAARKQAAKPAASGGNGQAGHLHTVFEGGHLFRVAFDARLDTGIFLDTRPVREMIQVTAAGKRFLNLFAYTGTASVYAAAGGAQSTHTIDLSQTYLDWARANMALNHFEGANHTFERTDVLQWVSDTRHSPQRFDLVYVDPPTFSNSKRMHGGSWDVQRDHVQLLIDVSRILSPRGIAIFCCNLRGFKPDVQALAKAHVGIADITARTIPADFERNPKVHQCFVVFRSS